MGKKECVCGDREEEIVYVKMHVLTLWPTRLILSKYK